jgi:hypothetical protein
MWSVSVREKLTSQSSRLMIYVEHARGFAMRQVASWNRSSSFWAMSQTTERYLGCKQRIRYAVNDRIGIEPGP